MKTISINLYTIHELKEQFPKGFERAHRKFQDRENEDSQYWQDEIFGSLKALSKHLNFTIHDYSLGAYNRGNRLTVRGDEHVLDLHHKRAIAWVENNLLSPLRIPWTGKVRWSVAKYGTYYQPGKVKPCPLTGVCYDEDFIEDFCDEVNQGQDIKTAFENLESTYSRLAEAEIDSRMEESYFIESAEANEWNFHANGDLE